jgi:hypothetical protein
MKRKEVESGIVKQNDAKGGLGGFGRDRKR